MELSGDMLMQKIANRENNEDSAKKAFVQFCSKYEERLLRLVEPQCIKYGYSPDVAFKSVECAFARVWKYHNFDKSKSKCKNVDDAIVIWLNRIAYTQILKFKDSGECAVVNGDENLAIITNGTEFYEISSEYKYIPDDERKEKSLDLDLRLSCMDEKHKIVLLTYLAYEVQGKNMPRTLLLKLRSRLNLKQSSIRVYKKEAIASLNVKI
ncbi:hypothetical protein prwr041_16380 [Prevotella herbatica]|uniref:Sigma-70 family RNA polymerase sigma factor n=1 Tax=Prevotella herbatica TaxID=2801997 RepID=A0ABM7NZ20_9BACT|nr:hypothetical protein [Prevotella herbatica]BCS85745.1 hypothetical protein prwr041_16380 [Prevotella herbatica]